MDILGCTSHQPLPLRAERLGTGTIARFGQSGNSANARKLKKQVVVYSLEYK